MAFNKVFVALLLLIMLIAPAMATARVVLKASDAFQSVGRNAAMTAHVPENHANVSTLGMVYAPKPAPSACAKISLHRAVAATMRSRPVLKNAPVLEPS
ncbi:hypothetical protein TIFTF001_028319 [Ficus carica]|uniref:Uncharacterized protein n=1 Tax=Ficus carica TaxID=3494 RepID=A0AA88J115_FICCA|nr:hypothetical protein TIFTF001_028319 [Ficus carica]